MSHDAPRFTAGEALDRLRAGNARFVAGTARFPTVQKEVLAALAKGQSPYATILGCSDSRVPPELLFDAGFGELFIVRLAGNVISPEVTGTFQYAGTHLRTPLWPRPGRPRASCNSTARWRRSPPAVCASSTPRAGPASPRRGRTG